MAILNIEFKARVMDITSYENKLLSYKPLFIGEDLQTDTYFNVEKGRLKLREGNIENSLIYYERNNEAGIKKSDVLLYTHQHDPSLKEILIRLHGIKVTVTKKRRIYFIDNVKFHFDILEELGNFIEVEAIDSTGKIGFAQLNKQCEKYKSLFNVVQGDFIDKSYSDLLLEKLNK